MSNPAVIKLCKKNIGRSRMWMDDNFGESIHLHIDDIRADLSCAEFSALCRDLNVAIDRLVDVEGFRMEDIDPVYFECMLSDIILELQKVKMDKVSLGALLAPELKGIMPLPESRCVKALEGHPEENNRSPRASALTGQSNQERLDAMLNSVKANGYPYKNNYIVLYGDDNIIRDGQHRAACLYHLYGDVEVPVLRLYFKDYVKEDVEKSRKKSYQRSEKLRKVVSERGIVGGMKFVAKAKAAKTLSNRKQKKIRAYVKKSGDANRKIEEILLAK